MQCGRGVLRGAGDSRTICFSPDAWRWRTRTTRSTRSLGIFILSNNSNVCLFENNVEMACWIERE